MRPSTIAAALLALLLASCLENEEEITVRPDGSASVRIAAEGDAQDLGDGYPVPLDGAWIPGAEALRWLQQVGPDTGSPGIAARAALLGLADRSRLEVRGEFRSLAELPRFLAPADEPYRSAHLERATSLEVRVAGSRAVYTFERVFRARDHRQRDLLARLQARLPAPLLERLESRPSGLSPAEVTLVAVTAHESLHARSLDAAREALTTLYTLGPASLPAAEVERVVEGIGRGLLEAVPEDRVDRLVRAALASGGNDEATDAAVGAELQAIERDLRQGLRDGLERELAARGVAETARNGVRAGLEWRFTADDHTADLADERFRVLLRLPGTVVGGNFDRVEDGALVWAFEGSALRDRDVVLRAVSVLE